MIRTFEELFEKMKENGHDPHRLEELHASYFYWKEQHEQNPGTAGLAALVYRHRYRDNLLGYLTCLQDTAYICQSEYDRLWDSLSID